MDISQPQQKKYCRLPEPKPLPIIYKRNGAIQKFQGIYDGFTVTISDEDDMKTLVSMGYFGKATLSRCYPKFDGTMENPEIIRKRQLENRKKLAEPNSKEIRKVIVVPDSDDDDDDEDLTSYFTNLQATYVIDKFGAKEKVNLLLEEAFFLSHALGCLEIKDEGKSLDCAELWELFSDSDPFFQRNYAVFYHFRCDRWVVKPGIKYGGDYLLYKWGPPFYHASYVVKIRNEEEEDMDITSFLGLQRMCETAGKELLICSVSLPSESYAPEELNRVGIRQNLMKRWIASQEREENDFEINFTL